MKIKETIYTFIIICILGNPLVGLTNDETKEAFHQRMKWWNDGRLGMFIHWGVYSTLEGEFRGIDYGKEMGNRNSEWIYLAAGIPKEDYEVFAQSFNPSHFDAKAWAEAAKSAGMKYVVLTTKHHDGFALFDTDASEWNSVQASGAHRDFIKDYVSACRDAGLKVGFYYSHEKDWWHHARLRRSPDPVPESYVELVRTQVTELLSNYGKIDLMWFDTPLDEHREFNEMCVAIVRKLQPDCIINGRIGNGLGDYQTFGDREIAQPGKQGYVENIMTMRLNWGYDRNDDFWKPSSELIKMVSSSACRSSNFLLNVGPNADGRITPEETVRLHEIGEWIKINGESIYETQGSPFKFEYNWGSFTRKAGDKLLYLHLWNWIGGDISLEGLSGKIESAHFLDGDEPVVVKPVKADGILRLGLPEKSPLELTRVIKLTFEEAVEFGAHHTPSYEFPEVDHLNHILFVGEIVESDGSSFKIDGIRIRSDLIEELPYGEQRIIHLKLNDEIRYRVNNNGDISSVQGFTLEPGQQCRIAFSPYPDEPKVEIITLIK